jgi:diadenosine tetraphosphate (Ap4A) HIT family hydrolase
MPTSPESNEASVEIGPPPYFHRSDCKFCRKQDGLETGSTIMDAPIPGGYVVEAEHFLVEHAPIVESSAGTLIIEARRHLLDFGDMAPTESTEFGSILHRLVPAIKSATGVERVYYLALMEQVAHFHLWLIPKKNEGELKGVAYIGQRPPLSSSASEADAMARKIRAAFESS